MSHKLVIDLPPTLNLPADVVGDHDELRSAIAVVLYKRGRISPAQARELMGVTRREFEDRLADYGFAVVDEADLSAEMNASERFARPHDM